MAAVLFLSIAVLLSSCRFSAAVSFANDPFAQCRMVGREGGQIGYVCKDPNPPTVPAEAKDPMIREPEVPL